MYTAKSIAAASVPSPDSTHRTLYVDSTTGLWCSKDDGGNIITLGSVLIDTYANRPAAAAWNKNMRFIATDIGNGAEYYSTGSAWKQIGEVTVHANSSLITMAAAAEVSIFDAAATLPNGCLAVGSLFVYDAELTLSSAASGSASVRIKDYIGATNINDSGAYAAVTSWNPNKPAKVSGMISILSLGAPGSAVSRPTYEDFVTSYKQWQAATPTAATSVTTTGTVTPDVKITMAGLANSPVINILNARIRASGLV